MPEDDEIIESGAVTEGDGSSQQAPPLLTADDLAAGGPPIPGSTGREGVDELRTVRAMTPQAPARRATRQPVTFTLDRTIDLTPGDPELDAQHRAAQDAVAQSEMAIQNITAEGLQAQGQLELENANILRNQIATEQRIQQMQQLQSRQTLQELTRLNQSVMDQRINPARFFTTSRGTGLSAAASVALGVIGQGLNPNIGNAAMTIIDRAIERDINAQMADMQNQQAGVAMARNLYGDLLNTFQNEAVAREALRGMYLTEMERRIQALTSQSNSRITRERGKAIILNLRRQQAEAAATAARERDRISYREITQGSQPVGSQRGIRSAAAQMTASAPLGATAQAQERALRGQPVGQVQPAAPQRRGTPSLAPGVPSSRDVIRRSDVRGQPDAADAQTRREAQRTIERNNENQRRAEEEAQSIERQTNAGRLSRRDARRIYRNTRSLFQVVPNVERIRTPHGFVPGVLTGRSEAEGTSGIAARNEVFRPSFDTNGQMRAISSNGTIRSVSPGDMLRSNERLMGSVWWQHQGTVSREVAQYVNRTSQPRTMLRSSRLGELVLPPSALRQYDDRYLRDETERLANAERGIVSVTRALNFMRSLETSGVTLNDSETQGALAPYLLNIQGAMGREAGLGVLQEGERQAIRDMSSLPSGSEQWVLPFTDYDRATAALRSIRTMLMTGQERLPIWGQLRRRPTGRDVAARHGAE